MDKLIIYLHQPEYDATIESLLQGLHERQVFEQLTDNTIRLTARIDPYEPLDYDEIYTLILSDFDQPTTFLVLTETVHNVITETLITEYLTQIPKNYYQGEELLLTLIKRHKESIPILQKALSKRLEKSLIETTLAIADANMNLSIAAKNMYMHRNSLHYRIDKIIEITGINIRTFKGLSIFTQLFRH